MPIASLQNIEKTYGQRIMFQGLNFLIDRGERVGLIGDNGAGKTTLFKTLIGEIKPDVGDVSIGKNIKVGYLAQDATFDPKNSVMDEAELAFADLHRLSHDLRELEHAMAEETGDALDLTLKKYEDVQHDFETAGGYAWRHKLEATLQGVGLLEDSWEQNVETLSGGQRSRLALAKLLISEPDLLLLDEPTNHLDLSAIEWLENYLLNFNGAVLLISHDRYLLDRLATRISWLTRQQLSNYPGNYSAFVVQREHQELSQARAYELQQADVEKQKEFIRRFGAGQRSKEAKGREKRLDRLLASDQMISAVEQSKHIHVRIGTDQRAGDRVLAVRELSKSFPGKQLWDNVKFEIKRGERIGIIGPNGAGKTTMLRVLMGQEDADSGDIKWGANLSIGYYDQRLDDFDPELTILEEVGVDRPAMKEKQLRDALGGLLFRGDDVHKPMALLSGGERARVALCELLIDRPNVLLLDEPTNHLDVNSAEALENALKGYNGTVICVSHDRYFLDKTVGRMLIIQPPNLIDFDGGYKAWIEKSQQKPAKPTKTEAKPQPKKQPEPPPKPAAKQTKDNPYTRQFGRLSVQELERNIADTEKAVRRCEADFGKPEIQKNPQKSRQLNDEHQTLKAKLAGLEEEYYARQ